MRSCSSESFEQPIARVLDAFIGTGGEPLSKFRDQNEEGREGQSKRFKSFNDELADAIAKRLVREQRR